MKRKAGDFSREEIFSIATEYSSGKYTYQYFVDKYNISQGTFYTIIKNAIVKGIVPDECVKLISMVAINNSSDHMAKNNIPNMFVANRGLRCNFVRELERANYTFSKSEAIFWIDEYLQSSLSKYDFCTKSFMTIGVFNRSFVRAIINSWIPLSKVEALREKAKRYNNPEKVDTFFDSLIEKRKQNRNRNS